MVNIEIEHKAFRRSFCLPLLSANIQIEGWWGHSHRMELIRTFKNMLKLLMQCNDTDTDTFSNESMYCNCYCVLLLWLVIRVSLKFIVTAIRPNYARVIFVHNHLLCNDTCSVTGGA